MAVHNDTVIVSAGLQCTALSSPAIGTAAVVASMAYTDGDAAMDDYVSVSSTNPASPTALHTDLGADGFVFVSNPSGGVAVTLYINTEKLGPLPSGFSIVVPVSSGNVVKGTVASTAQTVGVTAIKTTANA
jgi:hypothetical protein